MSPTESSGTRLAFLGDVMLGRQVRERLASEGPAFPWGDTLDVLAACHWRCLNLECVLSDVRTGSAPGPSRILRFRGDAGGVSALRAAGIDAVSLANNHVLDYGEPALDDMLRALDAAGIGHAGAGRDLEAAARPCLRRVNGLRIAFIACTDNVPECAALPERGGVFHVSADATTLFHRIAAMRREADLVIVSTHWGPNWGSGVPDAHRTLAHALIRQGADIVYGHSPHVCRGVEIFEGCPILYSTGSFIDDYAVSPTDRNDRSGVFIIELDGAAPRCIGLVPILVHDCQARLATGEEARAIIGWMVSLCDDLGTSARTVAHPLWPVEIRNYSHAP